MCLLDDLEDLNIEGTIWIGLLKTSNASSFGLKLDIKPDKVERPHLKRA
jgi:AsmA protein